MLVREAKAIIGGLSNPSKMPGRAFGLPAWLCKVGGNLQHVEGSTCFHCYALRGMYVLPGTKNAQLHRHDIMMEALGDPVKREQWIQAMICLLVKKGSPRYSRYFRWHDSGDLQSQAHFELILEVCRRTPQIKHWLPTREYQVVNCYLGDIPDNLVIRLSAHMVDHAPPKTERFNTSTVHTGELKHGTPCYAYKRDSECGGCRKCWNPNIANISYLEH